MAHILVIDDEPHIRNILEKLLTRDGHRVEAVDNGLIASKLSDFFTYDLVITDIVMPEKDGLEVICEFSKKSPKVPLIVISGGSERLDRDDLLSIASLMPISRVIPKPINYEELRSMVRELLGGSRTGSRH